MTSSVIERTISEARDLCREFDFLAQPSLTFAKGWVVCIEDAAFHARTREAVGVCVLDQGIDAWDVRVEGSRVSIHSGEVWNDPASWTPALYDAVPIGDDLAASVGMLLRQVADRIDGTFVDVFTAAEWAGRSARMIPPALSLVELSCSLGLECEKR